MTERYLSAGKEYHAKTGNRYWDVVREQERSSDRYLFGEEILWSAHAVPVGEREVRVSCRWPGWMNWKAILILWPEGSSKCFRSTGNWARMRST